jgi:hypothetical protein
MRDFNMKQNYRINGFEQIRIFYAWIFSNEDKMKATHVSLYMFLLNQCNRLNWPEWFKCPYDLAMQGGCIGSKTTYYKCLDELQEFGFIKYKKGINFHKAPQIFLIDLSKTVPVSGLVTVPQCEQVTEHLSVLVSGKIYKLLTNNHKRVSDNLEKWLSLEDNDERDLPEATGKVNNKPKDRAELWDLVRDKAQGIGFTEEMVKAYSKQIEECYRDKVDGVWRRSSDGTTPLNNWSKQIHTQWLTDMRLLEFKNRYLKLHPQQQVASLPKTRTI